MNVCCRKLSYLRYYICILIMYQVKHTLRLLNICNIFQEHNSSYNLRQSDFSVPSNTYGKHSLRHLGPILWSKLTTADRSVTSLTSFKNLVSKRDLSSLLDDGSRGCAHSNSSLFSSILTSWFFFSYMYI